MQAFATFIRTEPVRAMAILNAIIVVAVAFGAKLTLPQISAIGALAAAIFGVGSQITRSAVQPIAKMEPAQAVQVLEQAKIEETKPPA
jgi:hypothetical protein